MEPMEPSSVTLEEAVAKMIGLDYLPESVSLLVALEYLADLAQADFFAAQENDEHEKAISRFKEELSCWRSMMSDAERLIEDLENSIAEGEHYLKLIASDTARQRLSTQSVYEWAKEHHGIVLDDWKEFRGLRIPHSSDFNNVEVEGRHVLLAIAWLTDELLSRDWPAWKGNIPSLSPPKSHQYFQGKPPHPNLSTISNNIAKHLNSNSDGRDIAATVRKHVKLAIAEAKGETFKGKAFFSRHELPGAYKTLVGFYRMLGSNNEITNYINDDEDEFTLMRFISNLSRPGNIRNKEMASCLERALRQARDNNF